MFEQNFIIGNTPMIKINYKYKEKNKQIFVKLEYYNLTGSIKDRVAFYMINNAKAKGILKEKQPLIEATSGNTGISLSALGAYYNHPVYIFMPDWASKERIQLMKSYGANIFLFSKEEGHLFWYPIWLYQWQGISSFPTVSCQGQAPYYLYP